MEALAFVEELGRHGDVIRRHILHELPARIGRGYDTAVMLDDPYVAANHMDIGFAADGTLQVTDLGSANGTYRLGTHGPEVPISTSAVDGDDVFRLGQTQLRIRLPQQTVAAELPLQQRSWNRHPAVLVGSAGFLATLLTGFGFLATFDTDTSAMVSIPVLVSIAVLVWTAVWSLVCRTLHGRANFWAHGIVAFMGCSILLIVDTLTGYIDFAFDFSRLDPLWMLCSAAVLAGMLYHHLCLTVRLASRTLAALAVLLVAILIGGIEGYQEVRDANKPGIQAYDKAIKPSVFLFSHGIGPEQFVGATEKLKLKADKAVGAMAR